MKTAYEIIEQLRATSGLNDKREILRQNKDNEQFKLVLTQALDPRITFGIKKIPKYDYIAEDLTLEEAIEELGKLERREVTGGAATDLLQGVLETVSDQDAQVIKWIIAKDFKAGFGVSLINDEMVPFSVYEVPYMGAISYNEKKLEKLFKDHPYAYSEVKMDGRYLNVIAKSDSVFLESRGGKPNPLMGALVEDAMKFREHVGVDVVINGELMIKGEKDRYKANGIIASYVSIAQKAHDGKDITKEAKKFQDSTGMTLDEAKEMITLVAWDFITLEEYQAKKSETARSTRLVALEEVIGATGAFEIIEYRIVNNKAEAIEHFQEMLARGEEGTILKGSNGEWKDGKPAWQMKMKKFDNYDLRITGFNYGTPGTKNENVISSLNVESEDGLLKTSPGGIKEDMMEYITENMNSLLGTIVEVKGCGVSQDSEGNYSLLHPSFERLRDDKNHATTLEQCLDISNSHL
jgi:ATP-dependent DNA ligase